MNVLAAVVLILLHGPQHDIYVNPQSVTTMRAAPGGDDNRLVTGYVRCVLNTGDGKFISVIETCEEVRRLFR